MHEIRDTLSKQILAEFRESVNGGRPFPLTIQMSNACRVVSHLDAQVQKEFID